MLQLIEAGEDPDAPKKKRRKGAKKPAAEKKKAPKKPAAARKKSSKATKAPQDSDSNSDSDNDLGDDLLSAVAKGEAGATDAAGDDGAESAEKEEAGGEYGAPADWVVSTTTGEGKTAKGEVRFFRKGKPAGSKCRDLKVFLRRLNTPYILYIRFSHHVKHICTHVLHMYYTYITSI